MKLVELHEKKFIEIGRVSKENFIEIYPPAADEISSPTANEIGRIPKQNFIETDRN